jgi:hypothetical protein
MGRRESSGTDESGVNMAMEQPVGNSEGSRLVEGLFLALNSDLN